MCFSVSKIREGGKQMPWHQLIGPDELKKKMNVRISSRFVQSLSIDKEESWDDDLLSY